MVLEGPNYIYVDEKDFADDPYVIYLRNELGENLKSITGTAQYEVNKLSAELGNADVELVRKELGTEFDMIVHEPDGILEIGRAGIQRQAALSASVRLLESQRKIPMHSGIALMMWKCLNLWHMGLPWEMVRMWQRMRQNLLPQISIKMGSGTD